MKGLILKDDTKEDTDNCAGFRHIVKARPIRRKPMREADPSALPSGLKTRVDEGVRDLSGTYVAAETSLTAL